MGGGERTGGGEGEGGGGRRWLGWRRFRGGEETGREGGGLFLFPFWGEGGGNIMINRGNKMHIQKHHPEERERGREKEGKKSGFGVFFGLDFHNSKSD